MPRPKLLTRDLTPAWRRCRQERQLPRSSSQAGEDATSVEFRHIHHDDGADHAVCAGAFAAGSPLLRRFGAAAALPPEWVDHAEKADEEARRF
eukprot:s1187_g12.t1